MLGESGFFRRSRERVHKISSREYSKHFDKYPEICVDSKGNSYVVWEGDDPSKHENIYFIARLSDPGAILRLVGMTLAALAVMAAIGAIVLFFRKKKAQIMEEKD